MTNMDAMRTIVLGVARGTLENTPETKARIYDAVQSELVTGKEMGHKNYPLQFLALTPHGQEFAALTADDALWDRVGARMPEDAPLGKWLAELRKEQERAERGDVWYLTTSGRGELYGPTQLPDDILVNLREWHIPMLEFSSEEAANTARAFIMSVIGECLFYSNLAPLMEAIASAKRTATDASVAEASSTDEA